ncbi:MAG: polyphosphate:AMP phosphotransferase, partial [Opitutales bacterium]
RCRELGIPVLIVMEGLSASGKGTMINCLTLPLDPRWFKVTCIAAPTENERLRPFLWRFWRRVPAAGRLAIFDRSWYRTVLDAQVNGEMDDQALEKIFDDIRAFERQLIDGGIVIIKFWLMVSKKEQKKRLEELQSNPSTAWRVSKDVLERHKRYDEYQEAIDRTFSETNRSDASWTIIDCHDVATASRKTLRHLVATLRDHVLLWEEGHRPGSVVPDQKEMPASIDAPSLRDLDLSKTLGKEEYDDLLVKRQKKARDLEHEIYLRRIPVVIVYEGWDAAGKGGNIRRLTQNLDPRGYEVIPISAPNDVEKAHHHLWRFWIEFPKAGHITIFDRSWYGRVMVERVEGFCSEADWKRAFQEINEMEESFHHFGAIVVKFWLQIDPHEQLRRFRSREHDSRKRWKLSDEDWRNREKWPQYEESVEEMVRRTHTSWAPWTLVESNCKRHARIKALDTVIAAIEDRL